MIEPLKYYTENHFSDHTKNNIFHGFYTRLGGKSQPPYAGLNCGIGSDDERDTVQKNRALIAAEIDIDPQNLLSLYQIHSAKVLSVNEQWEGRPKADGFVTDKPGIALGILTADCAPVLFVGKNSNGNPIIGAAHAGWGGALGGVLENTVQEMERLGALTASIRACVGPCISKASYEVSTDFIVPFIEEHEQSEMFFHAASKEDHAMFDLSGYCAWRLFRVGLKSVALLDIDTYGNEAEFFSYRRATHRAESDYGRQLSVICINNK